VVPRREEAARRLLRLDGLHEVVARAQTHRLDHGIFFVHRGQRDHRRCPAVGPVPPEDFESVEEGHPQVQEDSAGRRGGPGEPFQTGLAVAGCERVVSDPAQQLDEDLASRLVVVDHEHLVRSFQHFLTRFDRVLVNGTRFFFPKRRSGRRFGDQSSKRCARVWSAVERQGTRFHSARSAPLTARCPSRFTA